MKKQTTKKQLRVRARVRVGYEWEERCPLKFEECLKTGDKFTCGNALWADKGCYGYFKYLFD